MLETAQISALELAGGLGQEPQSFDHGEGADAVVEGARNGQVVAQQFKFVVERDGIADAHQFLGLLAAAHADVDEQVVDFGQAWRSFSVLVRCGATLPTTPLTGPLRV